MGDVEIATGPLDRRTREDAALVAARAFYTDPFFRYLAPRGPARAAGLQRYFLNVCGHLGPDARFVTARRDGEVVGIAAWVAPGGYPFPVTTQVLQLGGALRALYRVPPAVTKGLRYLMAMEKAHPKEQLWYLQLVATDPEHQHHGVGSLLLADVHAQCDREGLGSYLETQKEANFAFYHRFGYEVTSTLTPVPGGPPLWTLRREPKSAS